MTSAVEPGALAVARRMKGITQADLAEDIGCSQVWVSLLERGKAQITEDRLQALEARLGDALPFAAFYLQRQGMQR